MASVCRFASSFHKISHGLLSAQARHVVSKKACRFLQTSSVLKLREVIETTEGNTTVVEGRKYESPRKKQLLNVPGPANCLCKLNLDIKYTDILIISQYVQEDGNIVPRQISGLCYEQHVKMKSLIEQAHRAGLMQQLRPHIYPEEYPQMDEVHWKKYNVYFPEIIDE